MGIRQFKIGPCDTCKRDTTQYAMRCSECGTVHLSGYEAYIGATRRIAKGPNSRVLRKARTTHTKALRRSRAATPQGVLTRGNL